MQAFDAQSVFPPEVLCGDLRGTTHQPIRHPPGVVLASAALLPSRPSRVCCLCCKHCSGPPSRLAIPTLPLSRPAPRGCPSGRCHPQPIATRTPPNATRAQDAPAAPASELHRRTCHSGPRASRFRSRASPANCINGPKPLARRPRWLARKPNPAAPASNPAAHASGAVVRHTPRLARKAKSPARRAVHSARGAQGLAAGVGGLACRVARRALRSLNRFGCALGVGVGLARGSRAA